MTTIAQLATEFAKGNGRKLSHPSVELRYPLGDAVEYRLHGNVIARLYTDTGRVDGDWCGWYTPTTANHLNHILKAFKIDRRVSYAQARDAGVGVFHIRHAA